MKKYIFYSLLMISYLHSADKVIKQLETDPAYMQAQSNVRLLKERFAAARYGARRGAQYGAATGAVVGVPLGIAWAGEYIGKQAAKGRYREDIRNPALIVLPAAGAGVIGKGLTYSAFGAGFGAALGATVSETKRRYALWKINSALQTYTPYNFMQLPLNESIMVFAAYQHDTALMRKIRPYVQRFLLKKGIWETLAYLYFGMAIPENMHTLKEMLK